MPRTSAPKSRCHWANSDPLYISYHDHEWGVPLHNDRRLFEMLNLEGAQAGLSWITILRKRPAYRRAFDNFNAAKVARYSAAKKSQLLKNPGIVRNRLKIKATVDNAKAFLATRREFGSFDKYIWSFTAGKTLRNLHRRSARQRAVAVSEQMSKDLKSRGFRFVGPTICYAFMQAVGILNDHARSCFRTRSRAKRSA
jgi:DNA-3-methyladenine glycosylase I